MNLASNGLSRVKELASPVPVEKTKPIYRKRAKWKRNWLCACGSGKKFKKCCWNEVQEMNKVDGNQSLG